MTEKNAEPAQEPQLAFELEIQSDEFVARVTNSGTEPIACRYFGWGDEPGSRVIIEILNERKERVGPIWGCGTGANRGWVEFERGQTFERSYIPELCRGELEPGEPFYLALRVERGGEEKDIFSEQLRWPHWEGYEARRQLMEKLLKPDKKDRSIEN